MTPVPPIQSKLNSIFAGLGSGVNIQIQPDRADLAFADAVASLPAGGGVLYVTPGTQPYVFQNTVVVSKPNTRIEFTSGPRLGALGLPELPFSYLAFPATAGPRELFRIEAPRFTCRGAYVKHEASNPSLADNDRSCFLVQAANDAHFDLCRFEFKQDNANIVDFSGIRAEGASDSELVQGLRIADCSYLINKGTKQSATSGTSAPRGIVCLRVRNASQVLLEGCIVRGEDGDFREKHCGTVIHLDNCPASVLADFSIRFLDLGTSQAGSAADSLIRIVTHGIQEGHRTVLARAVFEDIGTKSTIELSDARSNVIAYGNFGRIIPLSENAIEVNGAASRDVVIAGMNFHNISGNDLGLAKNFMIDLKSVRNVTVSAIVFFPFDGKQDLLRAAPGQCSGVVTSGALARLSV
jgi:hypothetical protein